MNEVEIPNEWNPRKYQRPLWKYLCQGGKRAVAIWHRRAGKDSLSLNWTAKAMLKRVGVYWHMLPLNTQARKVVWDAIDKKGRRVIDQVFPLPLRKSVNSQEMKIELWNGSIWQCVGSDNYNALVGSNPVGVVFSEYSLADPAAWDFIRPILAENDGWALFIYTPRGQNHGYTLYNNAIAAGWFAQVLTVEDTKAIDLSVIDDERRAGMPEAMIQQEFYCSFDAVNDEDRKLIRSENVRPALNRETENANSAPLIIGYDPAFQGDDSSAVARRKGRKIFGIKKYKHLNSVESANILTAIIRDEAPIRINIDVTGQGGIGIYDILVDRGYGHIVRAVNFAAKAQDPERYSNRRAEMWDRIRLWLMEEIPVAIIDENNNVLEDLTAPIKDYDGQGRLRLEEKKKIKERLGRSPDVGDAIALTFADQLYETAFTQEIYIDDNVYI